ncbi:molybdate ABC transporter substrate-binding protein [Budviciaceae bacterium BWR-B9]|uniref:Molybdate ABC transporter substrate-binding protein n=1 Tax=Limnobaculum allomyrinae TaxID=2791986 RepID=A0ABS1ILZ6_9GAMM|nr:MULTISPECIES: molybdate ABC transporter substrate-binding protein [Limnobaculum]MBK5142753.1 molybdate ABC transporter substrate-binding protein [Limnobaculum allomyrinae]MBV7690360.1 molybdate ABC transporter substrate-binding protein [Limnobaculum sp. M2-1]
MKNKLKLTLVGLLAAALLQTASAAEKITVFAAASLTNALEEIATDYKKKSGVEVTSSFASSSTLARQIEQGAPADMFISADQQWMDYVVEKKLMDDKTRVTLLGNDLVLVAPLDSQLKHVNVNKVTDWSSLLKDGRLAVGDPDHVPAGIYTKQALTFLGVWDQLSPKMARANNVRAALALVERAEAPLGIVYGSDAVASKKVKMVGIFPDDSHLPVEYPMAAVKDHATPVVQEFAKYLTTPEASAVFEKYGFSPRTK